jgi:SAM-dependent methyltransferase
MEPQIYDREFYASSLDGSLRSANLVLNVLYEMYTPHSVIDFGCGRGAWLAAAKKLGSKKLKGLDGRWIRPDDLLDPEIEFEVVDFEQVLRGGSRFDLCISVEVAEHISEDRAKPFVDALCRASDIVLFSAAIKFQGGPNHRNEQWQSYWMALFRVNGYACFDMRRDFWTEADVEVWYRQNVLLFIKEGTERRQLCRWPILDPRVADVVHPEHYTTKVQRARDLTRSIEEPTLRFVLGCLKRYLLNRRRRNL